VPHSVPAKTLRDRCLLALPARHSAIRPSLRLVVIAAKYRLAELPLT